jgi:hypothetical protein
VLREGNAKTCHGIIVGKRQDILVYFVGREKEALHYMLWCFYTYIQTTWLLELQHRESLLNSDSEWNGAEGGVREGKWEWDCEIRQNYTWRVRIVRGLCIIGRSRWKYHAYLQNLHTYRTDTHLEEKYVSPSFYSQLTICEYEIQNVETAIGIFPGKKSFTFSFCCRWVKYCR